MAEVTICIPAYRSEKFIRETLLSVQAQTFGDIAVRIAIEPAGDDTLGACEPFLADRRFTAAVNASVLGWDGNVRSLLAGIDTPYFEVLPHDDLLHPQYVETLVGLLKERPDASIAYGDMYVFGHETAQKSMPLFEGESVTERLVSFFLAGAEGVPWRGVARSEVLAGEPFPSNPYKGFAVECEWALHLLLRGRPCRADEPLYFKRSYEPAPTTVAREWTYGFEPERLKAALEHHRESMLDRVRRAAHPGAPDPLVVRACEAAMLRRYMNFSHGRFAFEEEHLQRAHGILNGPVRDANGLNQRIQAMALLALSRNELVLKRHDEAEALAIASVAADPGQWEGHVFLGTLLLRRGAREDAMGCAFKACALAPNVAAVNRLLQKCQPPVEGTTAA